MLERFPAPLGHPRTRCRKRLALAAANALAAVNGGLLWLLAATTAVAQISEAPSSVWVANYTGFVIAADEGTAPDAADRSAIKATVSVQFALEPLAPTTTFDYTAAFQLIDVADGAAQPLKTPDGVAKELRQTRSITVVDEGARSRVEDFSAALRPANPLDPNHFYRVRVGFSWVNPSIGAVEERGEIVEASGRGYVHFINTLSPDAPANVLASFDSTTYARRSFIEAASGAGNFVIHAHATAFRYDDFNEPTRTDDASFVFRVVLRDIVDAVDIPLATPETRVTVSLASHAADGKPAIQSVDATLPLRPAAGTKINHTHTLQATVTASAFKA